MEKLRGTKEGAVLRHMILNPAGITGNTAFTEYGLYRLAGAIHKLRRLYHVEIVTLPQGKQKYGRYKLARYANEEEKQEGWY